MGDRGELRNKEAEASVIVEYEARIAALERKVGQLTMWSLTLPKNTADVDRERQREVIRGCAPAQLGIKPPRSSRQAGHLIQQEACQDTHRLGQQATGC